MSGSIIQYDFPREECLAKSFTDSAAADFFGALNRADTTSCNDGLGVSLYAYDEPGAAQIISASTSASFVTHMTGKSSYTVEVGLTLHLLRLKYVIGFCWDFLNPLYHIFEEIKVSAYETLPNAQFWAATAVNLPAVSTNRPLVTIGEELVSCLS